MNKQIYLACIILAGLLFTSCEKTTFKKTIEVTVWDTVYNKGVPGVTMRVFQYNGANMLFHEEIEIEEITNSNGKAEIKIKPFRSDKASDVRVSVFFSTDCSLCEKGLGTWYIKKEDLIDDKQVFFIETSSPGYLYIDRSTAKEGNILNSENSFSLNYCNWTANCIVPGDEYTIIKWQYDYIDTTWHKDSIFCPAYEEISFTVPPKQ